MHAVAICVVVARGAILCVRAQAAPRLVPCDAPAARALRIRATASAVRAGRTFPHAPTSFLDAESWRAVGVAVTQIVAVQALVDPQRVRTERSAIQRNQAAAVSLVRKEPARRGIGVAYARHRGTQRTVGRGRYVRPHFAQWSASVIGWRRNGQCRRVRREHGAAAGLPCRRSAAAPAALCRATRRRTIRSAGGAAAPGWRGHRAAARDDAQREGAAQRRDTAHEGRIREIQRRSSRLIQGSRRRTRRGLTTPIVEDA